MIQVWTALACMASGGQADRGGLFALSECSCSITRRDEHQLNRFADAWLHKGQLLRITTRNILSSHWLRITMAPVGTSQDKYTFYQLMSLLKLSQALRRLNKHCLTKKRFIQYRRTPNLFIYFCTLKSIASSTLRKRTKRCPWANIGEKEPEKPQSDLD